VISSLVGLENPFEVLTERTIIYPIYEKHITRDPFFTLYQYFRRTLFNEDIVIVIGYSFRDLTINNAFSDWLASKPESRLTITAKKENHEVIRRIIDNEIYKNMTATENMTKYNLSINTSAKPDLLLIWKIL
jgi:hypothetical protein